VTVGTTSCAENNTPLSNFSKRFAENNIQRLRLSIYTQSQPFNSSGHL